jgi:hypothetical protein
MVEIMRVGLPAVLSPLVLAGNRISGPPAGEDIVAGDACYLTGDGRAYRSIGAAPDEAADVRGFAAASVRRGDAVTLVFDVILRYGEGLPSDRALYLSGTIPGGLADAPSAGGDQPVAFVVDATSIHALQS